LVVLHTTSFIFGNYRCITGGSVEVWRKNILYRFIEGQTYFGMQEVLKCSKYRAPTLNEESHWVKG
jgi:hypothetical protein